MANKFFSRMVKFSDKTKIKIFGPNFSTLFNGFMHLHSKLASLFFLQNAIFCDFSIIIPFTLFSSCHTFTLSHFYLVTLLCRSRKKSVMVDLDINKVGELSLNIVKLCIIDPTICTFCICICICICGTWYFKGSSNLYDQVWRGDRALFKTPLILAEVLFKKSFVFQILFQW